MVTDLLTYKVRGVRDAGDDELKENCKKWCADAHKARRHLKGLEFFEKWFLTFLASQDDLSFPTSVLDDIDCKRRFSLGVAKLTLRRIQEGISSRLQQATIINNAVSQYTFRRLLGIGTTDICEQPQTLLRIWSDDQFTRYIDELGFRCAKWSSHRKGADLEELKPKRRVTKESVRAHIEGLPESSYWISAWDDAVWALKYARQKGMINDPSCPVAIISVAKLERLDILQLQSDELIRSIGARPWSKRQTGCIHNAWPGLIMVFGMIPAPCIIKIFTITEFTQDCRARGIKQSKAPALARIMITNTCQIQLLSDRRTSFCNHSVTPTLALNTIGVKPACAPSPLRWSRRMPGCRYYG